MKKIYVLFVAVLLLAACDFGTDTEKSYPILGKTGTYLSWSTIECFPHDAYYFWGQEPEPNPKIDATIVSGDQVDFTFEVHSSLKAYNGMRYTGKLLTMKKH